MRRRQILGDHLTINLKPKQSCRIARLFGFQVDLHLARSALADVVRGRLPGARLGRRLGVGAEFNARLARVRKSYWDEEARKREATEGGDAAN